MSPVTDWFVRAKAEHQLVDIKQAKKAIAELPMTDSAKAIQQICHWLDWIADTEDIRIELRFRLIDLFDHATKSHQRKIGHEYQSGQRLQKVRENTLWVTATRAYKVLGDSYCRCIDDFQSGLIGSSSVKTQLAIIIARAVRALTFQLKWSLLRYGHIDDHIWGELGRLYRFAETQDSSMAVVEVYPGEQRSSVCREFLKAMMLSVSSTDALNLLKQDVAERAITHFSSHFVIQHQPGPGCNFVIDLSMHKPPARAQKVTHQAGDFRYFGAGDATAGLATLIAKTREQGCAPSDVDLGSHSGNTAIVLEVVNHLALYWSDSPPSRTSERHKVTMRLTVAPHFSGLLDEIEAEADNTLDFTRTESWIVQNASGGGYGAMIPQIKGDWIRVGALVGLKTETGESWRVGIIRRISQQRRVGIQILSVFANTVVVSSAGSNTLVNKSEKGDRAVLLSRSPNEKGEIKLLLPSDTYKPRENIDIKVRDINYVLRPSKLLERGLDFDCAQFEIIQRD